MNKKIIFTTKPTTHKITTKHDDFIDKWVEGKKINSKTATENEVRFTVVLPESLYFNLKMKAVKEKKKLKDLIKLIAENFIKDN